MVFPSLGSSDSGTLPHVLSVQCVTIKKVMLTLEYHTCIGLPVQNSAVVETTAGQSLQVVSVLLKDRI